MLSIARSLKYRQQSSILGRPVSAEFIDLCSEDSNNFCPIERCDLDGVVVVYDTTLHTSVLHAKEITRTLNALRIPHVIVGNKRDLGGKSLASELERSQNHFTVSAKEATADVIGAFSNLYNQLLDIDFHEGQVSKRIRPRRKYSTVEIPSATLAGLNSKLNRRQTVGGRYGSEINKALSAHHQHKVCTTVINSSLRPAVTNTTISAGVIENLEPGAKSRRGSWSIRLAKFVSKNVSRKKSSAGDSSSFDDPIDVDLPSSSDSSCSSSLRSSGKGCPP